MPSDPKFPLTVSLPAWFAWSAFSLLGSTWRYAYEGSRLYNPKFSEVKSVIFCFWHSTILQFAHGYRGCGVVTVVSPSRDGDLATAIAGHWGHATIRGSSSRGGLAAARNCIAALRQGSNIAILPDGPKGPREQVKSGVARLACMARTTVVPVATRVSRAWRLNSWDRFVIPKPGANITFIFGDAISTAGLAAGEEGIATASAMIQRALTP